MFFDAVQGTAEHYTAEQRRAWAGDAPDPDRWRVRVEAETGFAAEIDGDLVGFMTIDPAGHLDLAFVAPSAAGRGVGRRLHEAVEARARASGASEMTAEVSPAARSFFGRRGWETLTEQVVIRHGVPMTDFRMRKALELVSAISR